MDSKRAVTAPSAHLLKDGGTCCCLILTQFEWCQQVCVSVNDLYPHGTNLRGVHVRVVYYAACCIAEEVNLDELSFRVALSRSVAGDWNSRREVVVVIGHIWFDERRHCEGGERWQWIGSFCIVSSSGRVVVECQA